MSGIIGQRGFNRSGIMGPTADTQPAFQARPTSNQTDFAENTSVTVVFGTEIFDQGGDFASNTFTAPVTGKYQLNASIYFPAIQIEYDYYEVQIITSNRNYDAIFDPGSFDSASAYHSLGIDALADMDASDTAYVRVKASGTGGDASHDISTGSIFSGYLAC